MGAKAFESAENGGAGEALFPSPANDPFVERHPLVLVALSYEDPQKLSVFRENHGYYLELVSP